MTDSATADEAAPNGQVAESVAMPEPESDDLGRYLEDTITIDWQTPSVLEKARSLLSSATTPESRVETLFHFVRDEIDHSVDVSPEAGARATCRASEVLAQGTGICYAKSHLLAGLLRIAGFPTGFCYLRLVADERPDRFELHGFNAVYWKPSEDWIFLDARGVLEQGATGPPHESPGPGLGECRFEPPWQLAYAPDPERGESCLPYIYRRPAKRIIDLLERAPDLDTVIRNLPDEI